MEAEIRQNLRFNFVVNVMDATFFGFGLGFASTVTVLPLFLSTLTESTLLIGLIGSIQSIGWQLPQLLVAGVVASRRFFKPMTLKLTVHERWPYFGLAAVALLVPSLPSGVALALTYMLFGWHALGGGLTATSWQSLLGRVMPESLRGTFYGFQSSGYSLLSAVGAVIAGHILASLAYPGNYALCFFVAGAAMTVSWFFLAATREPENAPRPTEIHVQPFWGSVRSILKRDVNFRWFVIGRSLSQFAFMAINFYTIYAVRRFSMDEQTAGFVTSVLLLAQMLASPLVGWMGDRWGHRRVYALAVLGLGVGAFLALTAPQLSWFYIVFGLAGFAYAAYFTTILAMTVEFGAETERPFYIGLSNTLTAPATLTAPLIGGALADVFGFEIVFGVAVSFAILTVLVMLFVVRDPRHLRQRTAR